MEAEKDADEGREHPVGCSCCDDTDDDDDDEEEQDPKVKIARIAASTVLLIICMAVEHTLAPAMWLRLVMYLVPYAIAGYDVLGEAVEHIRKGHPFDEDFLMAVATLGALLIGFIPGAEPEFAEAVFVMLFFQVGEVFEDTAEDKSRDSITELMDIRPDTANLERDGAVVTVDPNEVKIDDVVVIRPGERVPMDGMVIEGSSSLDTVALTGESVPRTVREGDEVISGCVNQAGTLRVRVTKEFSESTASKILDLVENAGDKKSNSEHFITKFARVYTPIVVYAAIALAILPPLFSGDFAAAFPTWLLRALTFLVVSCPCALVVSVPLTFFGGLGGAAKQGVLIKGSNYLESLANTQTVVFDKTGTLTRGVFKVTAVHDVDCLSSGAYSNGRGYAGLESCDDDERRLLHLAAHVERYSTHPIALALRQAYPEEDDDCKVSVATEVAGKGVVAEVEGMRVAVGNEKLMQAEGVQVSTGCGHVGTVIHVAFDGTYAGHIVISDEVKPDARQAIANMRAVGVRRTVMLTGDRATVADAVASELGVDEVHAELLPQDKVAQVERLLDQKNAGEKNAGGKQALAFVGDGINDAPVLARADVGIAMGALGSDAAIEAADVVLMDDQPSKIAVAIATARHTLGIARQNIVIAIAIKVVILLLAAVGLAPMWLAVFGDVGVLVICVLNATRALRV